MDDKAEVFDLPEMLVRWREGAEALLRLEQGGGLGETPSDLPYALARQVLALIEIVESPRVAISEQQEWQAVQRLLGAMVSLGMCDLSEESQQRARQLVFVAFAGIRE